MRQVCQLTNHVHAKVVPKTTKSLWCLNSEVWLRTTSEWCVQLFSLLVGRVLSWVWYWCCCCMVSRPSCVWERRNLDPLVEKLVHTPAMQRQRSVTVTACYEELWTIYWFLCSTLPVPVQLIVNRKKNLKYTQLFFTYSVRNRIVAIAF